MEKEVYRSSETQQSSPVEVFVLDDNSGPTAVQKPAKDEGKEAITRETPSKSGGQSVNVNSDPHAVLATPLPAKFSGGNAGVDPDTAKPVRKQAWLQSLPKSASNDSRTPDQNGNQLVRIGSHPIKLSDEAMSMKHAIEVIMLKKIIQRRDAEAHFRCPRALGTAMIS